MFHFAVSSCSVTIDRHGVVVRAEDEDEVDLGREMAPLKLELGIARCIRLKEPS